MNTNELLAEIEELHKELERMQKLTATSQISNQKIRDLSSRLDAQIDMFTRIHGFTQIAFHVKDQDDFFDIVAEGVVDIFQLEVGAIFLLDLSGQSMTLKGTCNLSDVTGEVMNGFRVMLDNDWIRRRELWEFHQQKVLVEEVASPSPWDIFRLRHTVHAPLFDNSQHLIGIVMGGITRDGEDFYDFSPREISSSFHVYCQQMNGIFNNLDAIRQANDAGKAKSRFFANLSHEMRTPLNAILGMVQLAERNHDPEYLLKCISQIETSSKHLLALINDVLDYSKIEEGKLTLSQESFCFPAMVENIAVQTKPQALQNELQLAIHCNVSDQYYIGDELHLSQVLLNLLSNALKFTPKGGTITLEIKEISRQPEQAVLYFSVRDTGIGMEQAFQERVFRPFEQEGDSMAQKRTGTGLGLAISHRIVEQMGGELKVSSTLGVGSDFYFSIMLQPDVAAKAEPLPETDMTPPDFSAFKIMIVDDIEINQEIMIGLLENTHIQIACASNGQEAVDLFAASQPGEFSLIFMDVQMPIKDGNEAAREIRSLKRPDAKTIPIFAMTANAFKEDVNMAIRSGMNGHIGKPIQYETVLNTLKQTLIS